MDRFQYYAFISYSRKDASWAKWLQRKLENYKLPPVIRKENESKMPIRPVFVDKTDISSGNLDTELKKDLEDSRYLIVICSPTAAVSEWVDKEIGRFVTLGRTERIIPFIIGGRPDVPQHSPLQCYPSTLDKNILGCSIKDLGKERAFIKVVAKMLNLRADDLWQRHLRAEKSKKTILYSIITLLILALSVSSFWIWDHYFRITKRYYADYVDHWGIPTGIIELTPEQVAQRNYTYEFNFQAGKIRTVKRVNSSGTLVNPPSDMIETEGSVESTYEYLDQNLDKITNRDINGAVLGVEKFSNQNEIDFKNENGNVFTLFNATSNFELFEGLEMKNSINRWSLTRNSQGEITKIIFGNGVDIVSDANGIYGKSYQLDSLGRVLMEIYLDENGNPKHDKFGVSKIKYEYDKFGNKNEVSNLNTLGQLVMNDQRWARITGESDQYGNLISISFNDVKNELCLNKSGYATSHAEYDEKGRLISQYYFDSDNRRCLNIDGVFKKTSRYDNKGIIISKSYFDTAEKSCFSNDGYAKIKYEKNEKQSRISFYDTLNKPCNNNKGYSIVNLDYNLSGYLAQEIYFDAVGRPCLNSEGFFKLKHSYDEDKNEIEAAAFGKNDEPCYTKDGYSIVKSKWNKKGNPTEIAFFDTEGKPTYCNDKYSIGKIEYSERGNISKVSFFGIDSLPCYNNNIVSIIEFNLDEEKNKLLISCLGIDSLNCYNIDYSSKMLTYFNAQGKAIETYNLDKQGKLCLNKQHFAFKKMYYDNGGNITKESYFDIDSSAILCDLGYATVSFIYNKKNQIIEYMYFGLDSSLIGDGVAIEKNVYDSKDNTAEIIYFNKDTIAMVGANGFLKKKMIYNVRKQLVKAIYLDANDSITLNSNDIAIEEFEYNETGFKIKQSFFNKLGRRCLNLDKIWANKYERDDRGNLLEISNLGINDSLCFDRYGTAVYKYLNDPKGRRIREVYLNIDRQAAFNKDSCISFTQEYDDRGNVTTELYAEDENKKNRLCDRYVNIYDKRDQLIQTKCLDVFAKACKDFRGNWSIEKNQYTEMGLLQESAYYDEKENPVPKLGGGSYKISYEYDRKGINTRRCWYFINDKKPDCQMKNLNPKK